MSACKTGCGEDAGQHNETFCASCDALFMESEESVRFHNPAVGFGAGMVALVDFCNRLRAERLNGGTHESK